MQKRTLGNSDLEITPIGFGARAIGVSAGVVAISWTLRNEAVTGAIVGARNPQQIDGIIHAGECSPVGRRSSGTRSKIVGN